MLQFSRVRAVPRTQVQEGALWKDKPVVHEPQGHMSWGWP